MTAGEDMTERQRLDNCGADRIWYFHPPAIERETRQQHAEQDT